jgi:DNA-binding transcriptional ArsR family regulator
MMLLPMIDISGRLLLQVLERLLPDGRRAVITIDELAEQTGLSWPTVQRQLAKLCATGRLRREKDGSGYRYELPEGWDDPAFGLRHAAKNRPT